MGGYAAIAGSSYDGHSHLGSLELGALWKRKASTSDLGLRLGVVLPTSSLDDDASQAEALGAVGHMSSTYLARPSDFVASVPDGYDDGKMGFLFEMSTLAYLEDSDELAHVGAVTGQLHAGTTTPYMTVSMPFGDAVDFGDVKSLTLGVRGRL